MIRKTDPPDSNSHISTSGPGPGVSASAPTSENLVSPIPEDTQERVTGLGPSKSGVTSTKSGTSTSGVTRPGPSNHQHSRDTNRYDSGERFDYFVVAGNNNESVEDVTVIMLLHIMLIRMVFFMTI